MTIGDFDFEDSEKLFYSHHQLPSMPPHMPHTITAKKFLNFIFIWIERNRKNYSNRKRKKEIEEIEEENCFSRKNLFQRINK